MKLTMMLTAALLLAATNWTIVQDVELLTGYNTPIASEILTPSTVDSNLGSLRPGEQERMS